MMYSDAGQKQTFMWWSGFESRSAGGGRPRAPRGYDGYAGPEKMPVVYSVRWVPAPKDSGSSGPAAAAAGRSSKVGEVSRLNRDLQAPVDGLGANVVPVRKTGAFGI